MKPTITKHTEDCVVLSTAAGYAAEPTFATKENDVRDKQVIQKALCCMNMHEATEYAYGLELMISEMEPYVQHKADCTLGKRKWNEGKYDLMACNCGLVEIWNK